MKPSKTAFWLSLLIAVLALVAAGIGLFYQDGESPFSFITLHGQTVQMYGQGLYRYETLRSGAGFKGQDVAVPEVSSLWQQITPRRVGNGFAGYAQLVKQKRAGYESR